MAYKFTYNEATFCEDVMRYATLYYRKYERFYHSLYSGRDLIEKAQLHAIYHYTLNLAEQSKKERGCFIKDLHRQLCELEVRIPENYDHFSVILKKMGDANIETILEHKSKGKPRHNSRKFHPILIEYAEVLYVKSLSTHRQILTKVNAKARVLQLEQITIHIIKKYFSQKSVQSRLRPIRNGKDWFLANTAKQQHFSKPEFSGQQLEIDGSRLQIAYNNTIDKKIDFLSVFGILDVAASKLLGYAHGKSESSMVVVNAFKRFFSQYDFLPLTIVRDNGSAYKKNFVFIETLTAKRGVEWIHTPNPRGKPHIENFFKTFAKSICSYHDNYIGLGITATHIDSRYSKSKLKEKIGNRNLLATYEEIVMDIDFLMNEFNNTKFDYVESGNYRFERLFDENELLKLPISDKVAMTGIFKSKSVTNSEISIEHNNKKHFYQFPNEVGENLEKVNIAYDLDHMETVYVFDENLEFQMNLSISEIIPSLRSKRSSSQQEKYIRELAARKSRFRQLENDIIEKEKRVEEVSKNALSFEVLRIHRNKEDEIEAQNEFTRNLIQEEKSTEKNGVISFPSNSFSTPIDRSLFNKSIE